MIGAIAIFVFIFAFGFGYCWFFDGVRRVNVVCDCGGQRAADCLLLDPEDIATVRSALLRLCPVCCGRRYASRLGGRES